MPLLDFFRSSNRERVWSAELSDRNDSSCFVDFKIKSDVSLDLCSPSHWWVA